MQLKISSEAASCAATHEFSNITCNPNVHYRAHDSPPPVPILSQIDPVHTTPSYLRSSLILSTYIRLGLPSGLFPSGFPTKPLYSLLFSPNRATRLENFSILDLITLIILGEKQLLSSSLCNFMILIIRTINLQISECRYGKFLNLGHETILNEVLCDYFPPLQENERCSTSNYITTELLFITQYYLILPQFGYWQYCCLWGTQNHKLN
jgi:hypothetical protein